eukprot:INCI16297.15.p1 GENE.INCI16297.15~~INCI16297.15.p1  ORF type:complete len:605 (+),score=107.66 INCI16297.15:296-2110(+)
MFAGDQWHRTGVFDRQYLTVDSRIQGPAIIREFNSTTVVEPEWEASLTEMGALVLRRMVPQKKETAIGTDQADPITLEIFNNLFMSVAEQMGATLENVSHSVNIKERLDFSCALFDHKGQLIANAPHIPVHLGSMGDAIRNIISLRGDTCIPGDVFVTNAPYNGGTHIPDVTVITPVFHKSEHERGPNDSGSRPEPLFWVGSRGHHQEIGGITPGSIPPFSTHIEQEGILIDNFQLVDGSHGSFREEAIVDLLKSGPYPSRNINTNLSDLRAQIAANERGITELHAMIDQFTLPVVQAYMQYVMDNAEECVRRVIDVLQDGEFTYADDDGGHITCKVSIDQESRSATVDFTGTSEQRDNNFNAPKAIGMAAVLYVFRTLVQDSIPLNEGCLKPLNIILPEGSMINPRYPAAVVAGNTEVSQMVTETLYGALGVLAGSQGTMNNFTFGNEGDKQYYETICGGTGASPNGPGCDAVHSHMTNTRLTDPEILEFRYPVLLDEFSIRRGTGGQGHFKGGDGIHRAIRFLEPMEAQILSNHRKVPTFGLEGGGEGEVGRNYVIRRGPDGKEEGIEDLGNRGSVHMRPGDTFVIDTPGGGAFGKADGTDQ